MRQFDHQAAGRRRLRERYFKPGHAALAPARGPVHPAQKGHVLAFQFAQGIAAERLQVAPDDADPAFLALAHAFEPGIDTRPPILHPGLFGFGGIALEGGSRLFGKKCVLLIHVAAPGPAQPDHQQAEPHQQDRQFPE
ncbi:hypothetical protein D3C86_1701210 [compost metagenome]